VIFGDNRRGGTIYGRSREAVSAMTGFHPAQTLIAKALDKLAVKAKNTANFRHFTCGGARRGVSPAL